MATAESSISLKLPLDPGLTGLVPATAENVAQALGLGRGEAMKLALAGEEVYAYLCQALPAGSSLDLVFSGHVHHVRLALTFPRANLDLRLFNLTAGCALDSQEDLAKLGLLIASRLVDESSFDQSGPDRMTLVLDKHKAYPPAEGAPAPPPVIAEAQAVTPGPAEIKELALLLAAHFPAYAHPSDFALPGKLADMVQSGEYGLLAASDRQGGLGGMLAWQWGSRSIRLYGPYLFGQPDPGRLGRELVDACLRQVAKSGANSLVCRYSGNGLPSDQFELLGELDLALPGGQRRAWPHYYRQLSEDPGAWAWCHPALRPFLESEYRRLFLPRSIRELARQGEARAEHSVLAARLERGQARATLRPVWDGADLPANLAAHVTALRNDGFANLLMTLDTGSQWQAGLAPELMAAGFAPRLILPGQAAGDLVVFQHGAS
ncbi:MAG: hypothetical protein ACOZHQ_14365 [Thermodesulfobacteriota bacterium]